MKTLKLFLVLLCVCFLPLIVLAQGIEVKDNSKVGFISTGSGNTITVTQVNQVVGKSPEYAQLQKHLADLETKITKKIATCAKLNKPDLADLYKDCQNELGGLNIEQDSFQKIEKQFKEDVLKLAETFSNTKINSDRLRKAKALFDAGKINEVHFVLNDKEMTAEGDAHLLKKQMADSFLQIDAKGFIIKAQAKATDYSDPKRIDSTAYCYTQALKYYDDVQTLYDFAKFYKDNQQYEKAKETFQKVITHPEVLYWQRSNSYANLGDLLTTTGNLNSAMEFFTKYYEAYKASYEKDTSNTFNKQNLSVAIERLGNTQTALGNLGKALGFYEEYNKLESVLYAAYPNNVEYKNHLAISYQYLGIKHMALGNLDKALGFYEEYNRLEKELYAAYPNNVEFKNGLAISYQNLGISNSALGNIEKAMKFYENYNNLEKQLHEAFPNNVEYKNLLAISYQYLGITHTALGNLDKSLKFYEDFNKLESVLYAAYPNNVKYKNGLSVSYQWMGWQLEKMGKPKQSIENYSESEKLLKQLIIDAPAYIEFKNNLAWVQKRLAALK